MVFFEAWIGIIDLQAEAGRERQLFLHRVRAVDIALVFHIFAVVPGLTYEMPVV